MISITILKSLTSVCDCSIRLLYHYFYAYSEFYIESKAFTSVTYSKKSFNYSRILPAGYYVQNYAVRCILATNTYVFQPSKLTPKQNCYVAIGA